MKCEEVVAYLSDYIDNNLDEAISAEVREHLETCTNCHIVLDTTQKSIALCKDCSSKRVIPTDRRERLFGELQAAFLKRDQPSS